MDNQEKVTLAAELLALYRDKKRELEPALLELDRLERQLKDVVLDLGEAITIEGASTTIRNGYTRKSWDGKKLEGLALVYPEINRCYNETVVKEAVVVKVEK